MKFPKNKKTDLFAPSQEKTYSVSELAGEVRSLLEGHFAVVRVAGEVSGLKVAASGHAYFSLKDDRASIPAVLFRSAAARLGEVPAEGEEIECLCRLTMYEPRGRTQLIVEWLVPRGVGALGVKFIRLREKLAAEGLFDAERKRPLPFIPEVIGIVTSPSGAAIRDILKVLKTRLPSVPVLISPVRVQGEGAADEIAEALDRLGSGGLCDVIIVGRGGGSLEDLWSFNEETVVRAVVDSPVPVISAVGHEVDTVLSDLAADVRAATPTAAAEMVVPDRMELQKRIADASRSLVRDLSFRLGQARADLREVAGRIRDPRLVLANHRIRLDEAMRTATRAASGRMGRASDELTGLRLKLAARDPRLVLRMARSSLQARSEQIVKTLRSDLVRRRSLLVARNETLAGLSPMAVLERGYGLVSGSDGRVLKGSAGLSPGDEFNVRMHRGSLDGVVERVYPPADPGTDRAEDGD